MFMTRIRGRSEGGRIDQLEAQIATRDIDRALLIRDLGTGDAQEIIAHVRALEKRNAELISAAATAAAPPDTEDEGELAKITNSRDFLAKVRDFTTRIRDLNSTVGGMEEQLLSVYEEKELMERQLGAGDLEGLHAVIGGYRLTINSMEQQLMNLYASREVLEAELGTSDSRRIVSLFQNVSGLMGQMQEQMASISLRGGLGFDAVVAPSSELPRVTPAMRSLPAVPDPPAMPLIAAAVVAPIATPMPTPITTPVAPPAPVKGTAKLSPIVTPTMPVPKVANGLAASVTVQKRVPAVATGNGLLPPDDPRYDPLSNPNDPLNDDSLINGTP